MLSIKLCIVFALGCCCFTVAEERCQFPEEWAGIWYQADYPKLMTITRDKIDFKGVCIATQRRRYFVYDEEHSCYRCMVMHIKDANVMQYKETGCYDEGRPRMKDLCDRLFPEVPLHTLFREIHGPIKCPFVEPYIFSYSKGRGVCKNPPSSIDRCEDETKFVIRYQACPDVEESESETEEIQCYSSWKTISTYHVVGKVAGNSTLPREMYRCFVYEPPPSWYRQEKNMVGAYTRKEYEDVEYEGSVDMDVRCLSAYEGSRIMTYIRAYKTWKCSFPKWLTQKKYWHTLDHSRIYSFVDNNSTLYITNVTYDSSIEDFDPTNISQLYLRSSKGQRKVYCVHSSNMSQNSVQLLTYHMNGCKREFVCLMLRKRNSHIVEVQAGLPSETKEYACSDTYFHSANFSSIILLSPEPETKPCPFFGDFRISKSDSTKDTQANSPIQSGASAYTSSKIREEDFGNFPVARSSGKIISKRYAPDTLQYSLEDENEGRPGHAANSSLKKGLGANNEQGCVLNFNKVMFGCRSPDTVQFESDCPLSSGDIVSVYLCHGILDKNVACNLTKHYAITRPLNQTSESGRYRFMYGVGENSSTIEFASTKNARQKIYRGNEMDTFNMTPTQTGQCAGLMSTSGQVVLSIPVISIEAALYFMVTFAVLVLF